MALNDTAIALAPVLIGRCIGCPQGFRAELSPQARVLPNQHWRVANAYARTAGFTTWHDCRDGVRCPQGENGLPDCGDWECAGHDKTEIHFRVLKSEFKPEVACSPGRCHEAKSSTCTCSCNGANHGAMWKITTGGI
jgi:hypothetical protein